MESNEKDSRLEGARAFVGLHVVEAVEEESRYFCVPLRGTGEEFLSGLVIVETTTGAML